MLDSAKARKNGWQPKLSIDDALSTTFDWFINSLSEKDALGFQKIKLKNIKNKSMSKIW